MLNTDEKNLVLVAKTLFGLEEILADELKRLGARDVEELNRAVRFKGDKGMIYKSNLCSRTALRILVPIATFEVSNEQSLYDEIKAINWEDFINADDTIAIDTVLSTDLFNHTRFISQKTKDAIADQFREKHGKRPDVDLDRPTLRISLHIHKTTCSVSLDSSGESLHKRGYRDQTNLAPINEVLAAGLVLLTGWDRKKNLVDPMCGSGTILIEAAMIAANIPPGYYRVDFGFMRWKKFLSFDEELWKTIYDAAISRITSEEVTIIGGELSHHVTRKAKENVKLARVEDLVKIVEKDITEFETPEGPGILIINPPYGERMDQDNIPELYKSIGDSFKKRFTGYDCWLITSNMEALKFVGLRPSRKIQIYNGPLECRFVKYQVYQGTKKIHKLNKAGE
jgi:putative N6-adenine-specific DNA methylase